MNIQIIESKELETFTYWEDCIPILSVRLCSLPMVTIIQFFELITRFIRLNTILMKDMLLLNTLFNIFLPML